MTSSEIEEAVKNLQNFDWTSEIIKTKDVLGLIEKQALSGALDDYCRRRELSEKISPLKFLESIGATQNGYLVRGGLLFLGKKEKIQKILGNFEYRFSRKTKDGRLLLNKIWHDNLWNTIKRVKKSFEKYNITKPLNYKENIYEFTPLDETAFHEAFFNALVHRDYTIDGMTVVNYMDSEIKIASPELFYGGVNEQNIAYHEPRHRNKSLANILMKYQFIDRAGMGVLRMGLGSLKFGRSFPTFKEKDNSIEVSMQTEYLRIRIFILSIQNGESFGISEWLVLNLIYEKGYIEIGIIENRFSKISNTPWSAIKEVLANPEIFPIIELCGTNEGVYIKVKENFLDFMEVKREFRPSSNSIKHVKLYEHLKEFSTESNSNLTKVLGYNQSSSTSKFLKNAQYVTSNGKSRSIKWCLMKKKT